MATIYEQGILAYKSEIKTGVSKAGKQWSMQTIVVDVPGANGWSRKVALTASLREVEKLQTINVGDQVKVGYQVNAREYNGRWYNDVSLTEMETMTPEAPATDQVKDTDTDLPF